MAYSTLQELLNEQLVQLYAAKSHLAKVLPSLIEGISSSEFKSCLRLHLEQTKKHVESLESELINLNGSVQGTRCKVIDALIQQGMELFERPGDEVLLDTGLIFVMRHIENYECSCYEHARTIAEVLGYKRLVAMLDQHKEEDEEMERSWTVLGEDMIDTVHVEGIGLGDSHIGSFAPGG